VWFHTVAAAAPDEELELDDLELDELEPAV
jgi:hypothetical protein